MGILHTAYRTYESQAHMAGVTEEEKEPLTPLSHAIQNAHIEITISPEGRFVNAAPISKKASKTIIPVTIESANRTGENTKAHPLSDQLRYLADFGGDKYVAYVKQLTQWAESEFSHPKVQAVLAYISSGTIVSDLAAAKVIYLEEEGEPAGGRIEGIEFSKCLVRWRISPVPDGVKSACWEDITLFSSFAGFYRSQCAQREQDICMISGEEDMLCDSHPKGVLAASFGAKLLSANDSKNYTYRGRFTEARQAYNVGYEASQKAHHALHWVAANYGVYLGGRTFLCWNPNGVPIPSVSFLMPTEAESDIAPKGEPGDFVGYRRELHTSLGGYRQALTAADDVVIASLDAATTGRLSVTYYNELKASDFLDRVEHWYETFCWDSRYGVQSPSLRRIVKCAFGAQRGNYIETDDRILREHVQRLLHCIVDRQPLPADLPRALASKCGSPLAYSDTNRETLLITTCAVLRKYHNDRLNKEVWNLALDPTNDNRSYLFGRLLAVAEYVERSTYQSDEGREPNAIRMQSVFSRRPMYAWRIIEESLNPYFARKTPGSRSKYKKLIGEISDLMPNPKENDLDQPLEDIYLLGYYHQRNAMYRKKDKTNGEEQKHESVN